MLNVDIAVVDVCGVSDVDYRTGASERCHSRAGEESCCQFEVVRLAHADAILL